jgi:WD40 repeat protein
MSTIRALRVASLSVFTSAIVLQASALTGHFNATQDSNYNFQIYTAPISGEGCGAWTMSGNLLTRGVGFIREYNLTPNTVHQGTNVRTAVTHVIPGLDSGVGITNGTDGYLYTVGSSGIMRVDPNNWAAPAVYMPNSVSTNGWGINTLPNGKLVYSGGADGKVYLYNPSNNSNQLIYSAPTLIDDMETGPGGEIALAGQGNGSIIIIDQAGSVIKQFNTSHYPDGLAFGDGPFGNSIYANNNDGTVTRYDFGSPGYQGTVTPVDIATTLAGNHGYGDLATVGPDCAFYVSTFNNPGFTAHGNTAGIGTNWDNGVSNGEDSIVRIGFNPQVGPDGSPIDGCGFYSLIETLMPEPGSMSLAMFGVVALFRRNRRA